MRQKVPRLLGLPIVCTVVLSNCGDPFVAESPTEIGAPRASTHAGAQIVVNSALDPGDGVCTDSECTLREAIAAVDMNGEIVLAVGENITLAGTELSINKPLTISGPGVQRIISAGNASRVFFVNGAGAVHLKDITLTQGLARGPGGCVRSDASQLTLTNVRVVDCDAWGAGGGISASAGGQLALERVLVADNWASDGGGGLYVDFSVTATVSRSTFARNEGREGGGLGTTGFVAITSSTFSGNNARFHGGGVYAADRGPGAVSITSSTIVGNTSDSDINGDGDGGGVFNSGGSISIVSSILADNTDTGGQALDCGAANPQQATGAFNLIASPVGCAAYTATASVTGASPQLGPLADNGGDTPTHLPSITSPVIDMGGASCPAIDQRGLARPRGAACDIGSVESAPPVVSIDVRPGSSANPINLRIDGLVPVAILSSTTFDATQLALSSIRLGNAAVALRPNGQRFASMEDVNGDGRLDLLVHFTVSAIGLTPSSTQVLFRAVTTGGLLVEGRDVVTIVP